MSAKRDAFVSLKWPVFVAGVGACRYLRYSALRTVGSETECSVSAVVRGGKWVSVPRQVLWLREDCVASRQYVDQAPEQLGLPIA